MFVAGRVAIKASLRWRSADNNSWNFGFRSDVSAIWFIPNTPTHTHTQERVLCERTAFNTSLCDSVHNDVWRRTNRSPITSVLSSAHLADILPSLYMRFYFETKPERIDLYVRIYHMYTIDVIAVYIKEIDSPFLRSSSTTGSFFLGFDYLPKWPMTFALFFITKWSAFDQSPKMKRVPKAQSKLNSNMHYVAVESALHYIEKRKKKNGVGWHHPCLRFQVGVIYTWQGGIALSYFPTEFGTRTIKKWKSLCVTNVCVKNDVCLDYTCRVLDNQPLTIGFDRKFSICRFKKDKFKIKIALVIINLIFLNVNKLDFKSNWICMCTSFRCWRF